MSLSKIKQVRYGPITHSVKEIKLQKSGEGWIIERMGKESWAKFKWGGGREGGENLRGGGGGGGGRQYREGLYKIRG